MKEALRLTTRSLTKLSPPLGEEYSYLQDMVEGIQGEDWGCGGRVSREDWGAGMVHGEVGGIGGLAGSAGGLGVMRDSLPHLLGPRATFSPLIPPHPQTNCPPTK